MVSGDKVIQACLTWTGVGGENYLTYPLILSQFMKRQGRKDGVFWQGSLMPTCVFLLFLSKKAL